MIPFQYISFPPFFCMYHNPTLSFLQQSVSTIINTNVMMNSGYFTSRNEIIEWINQLLSIELTKIEQLGSGNIYCHILDAAYPGKVQLSKVKWNAYLQVDFLHNFKVLQTAFEKIGIKKVIETQRLVKAKYQDNLEFIQWMKWFLSTNIKDLQPYDALTRRNYSDIYLLFTEKREGKKQQKNTMKLENKQNIQGSVSSRNLQTLKTHKSVEHLKTQPFKESDLRRAFQKGEALRALLEPNENSIPYQLKKTKKQKLQVTLKPSIPLHERHNLQKSIQQDQCF